VTREYLKPAEVDQILSLPNGRAARLARKGLIPAVILPDGTIRLPANIIETLKRTPTMEVRAS